MPRPSPQQRRAAARRAALEEQRDRSRPTLDLRPALATSTIPGVALLPLRLFLGITFLYAGWQKLTDPGFLTPGSTSYIGAQLQGFAHGSPISFILSRFVGIPVAVGVLTIFTEFAIGLLVTLGLFTRIAALGGLLLNLIFFLSASWHVYPYFLGSDIVFVMAWLTLVLAGPGAYFLDAVVAPRLFDRVPYGLGPLVFGRVEMVPAAPQAEGAVPVPLHARRATVLTRGEALAAGAATLILVLLGLSPKGSLSRETALPASTPGAASTPPPAGSSTPTPAVSGQKVGNTSQIPVNSAVATTDPKSGDPAVVVHTTGSTFVAYDAVCTHAGCTVEYDPQYKLLICPCHGGAFDPAHGGQVVSGPPPAPLTSLPIKIDASGNVYLT